MKASELSIGDWVQVHSVALQGEERLTPPMRVVEIGETWVNLEIDPEQGDPFEEDIDDIRPIPLTADILKRNGFVHWICDRHKDMYMLHICSKPNIFIRIVFFRRPKNLVQIEFNQIDLGIAMNKINCGVHELQHVMRMMGIDKNIIL